MVQRGERLWEPTAAFARESNVARFMAWLAHEKGLAFRDYDALWSWSVSDLEAFWAAVWQYFGVSSPTPYARVLGDRGMPGAHWFPGARTNFAEHLLAIGQDEHARTSLLTIAARVRNLPPSMQATTTSHNSTEGETMRRIPFIVLIVLLAAAPALGQIGPDRGQRQAYAGAGFSLPTGDFGDLASTGFLLGGGYGYYLQPQIEIGGEINYTMYGSDIDDVDVSGLSFVAVGKYLLAPEFTTAYLKGGLGLYRFSVDTPLGDDSSTDLGLLLGGGYQYRGDGNTGFFGEGTLNLVATEGDSTQFLNLRGGLIFYFSTY